MIYGMEAFSRPFDASDYRDKSHSMAKKLPPRSVSFHDREEIRRRLAMDADGEEFTFIGNRVIRKSSLSSRLQNGQTLQICFMNESTSDLDSHESDDHSEDETNNSFSHEWESNSSINNCAVHVHNTCSSKSADCGISPNNNTSKTISNTFTQTKDIPNISTSVTKRQLNFNNKLRNNISNVCRDSMSEIPKPNDKNDFHDYHSRLHEEARMALTQAKTMAKMQMEVERQLMQKRSPIVNLIGLPFHYQYRKNKLSHSILSNMSVSQLQIIANDLYSQIELFNEELVRLLLERDELHMEQDSILVDIEDLTIFLCSK